MKESYWTLGQYDVVAVFEAPDDESMTAFSLSVARLGNVKTQTLRAFSSKEMPASSPRWCDGLRRCRACAHGRHVHLVGIVGGGAARGRAVVGQHVGAAAACRRRRRRG